MATLPSPGEAFGAYDVVRVVGRGPSGVVLQAVHREQQRSVALKVLLPSVAGLRGYRDYFLQQVRVLGTLGSAHVVGVHDAGVEGRLLFVATDLLGGGDVGQLVGRTGPLAPALAVRVVAQAARGLADLHRAGLVHGDLKTANVLLRAGTDTGPGDAVLCDVGLPRVSEATVVAGRPRGADATVVSGAPAVAGTGLAPEHQDGRPPTVGSDVHELGCVLWELLTGAVPPAASSAASVPRLPDPHPAELDAVLAHTLAPDPAARYRSAADLQAALEAIEGRLAGAPAVVASTSTQLRPLGPPPPAPSRPVEAPAMSWPQSPTPRPGPSQPWPTRAPTRRRGRVLAAVAAVVLVAGVATAGALALSGGDDGPAPSSRSSSPVVASSGPTTSTAAPDLTEPQVGECRKLVSRDLDEPSNNSPTVPCGDGATAQTVFVGTIATRATTDVARATAGCFRPELKLLGVPATALMSAGVYYVPFQPDDAQWEAGARWVRCDVYVRASGLVDLPADLSDIFVDGVPLPRYRQCLDDNHFMTACASYGTFEFAGAFAVDGPAKQPGEAALNAMGRQRCPAIAGPRWYATWFGEDNWNAGLRTITCWKPR